LSTFTTINTVSAIKKQHCEKMSAFSAIFYGDLKCCIFGLNYWITFTKGLSNWEKVKIKQQEPTGLSAKTGFCLFGRLPARTTEKVSKRFPLSPQWPSCSFPL
jgi:hypothetical protein